MYRSTHDSEELPHSAPWLARTLSRVRSHLKSFRSRLPSCGMHTPAAGQCVVTRYSSKARRFKAKSSGVAMVAGW